jgi:exodeoxyribonuclease VII large subunit
MIADKSNNIERLSVSRFNALIKLELESLGEFQLIGEITEFSVSKNQGVFMVLKDQNEDAVISLAGYAPRVEGLNMIEKDMQVVVWGTPTIYSPYGKFNFSIYKILPLGEGALNYALELLKKKLESEGLFNVERKRPLPEVVTKIALITAKDSAAYSDFIKVLNENNNNLEIDFYPVAVQGKHAIKEITSAIMQSQDKDYDALVVIRGGGSLEDLSSFNDETVTRAIFSSKIITMVAVGHEKDISICELAADIRASTPTQAAYYFVANTTKLIESINMQLDNIFQILFENLSTYSPDNKFNKIKNIVELSYYELLSELNKFSFNFDSLIINKLNIFQNSYRRSQYHLKQFDDAVKSLAIKINSLKDIIDSNDPELILKRGYSVTRDKNGNIVKSVSDVQIGDTIKTTLSDGKINSKINNIIS